MTDPAPAITLETLSRLSRCLPTLTLDPATDGAARDCPGFSQYLDFYSLDFFTEMPAVFHALGSIDAPPYRIAGHYWLPSRDNPGRETVVLVHGYFDHVGLYHHLIRHLLERGYAVVAFDLPGHGLSSGERASIESFDHYVAVLDVILALVRRSPALPDRISAIGQSTGGAILIKRILEEGGDEFRKVTVLAPLVAPVHWWLNRFMFAVIRHFRERISRKFLASSSDPEFLDFLADRDPLQDTEVPLLWIGAMKAWIDECRRAAPVDYPVTIVQGDNDGTIAWRYNLRLLRKKLPKAQLRMIPGAGHHLVNERADLRRRVFAAMGFDGQ